MDDTDTPFPQLSAREREVAALLALGHTNRFIAEKLDVSVKTIDTHRAKVLRKLGVVNNVELTHLAIYNRYVTVRSLVPPTQPARATIDA